MATAAEPVIRCSPNPYATEPSVTASAAVEVGGDYAGIPEYPAVAVACLLRDVVGVVEFALSYDFGRESMWHGFPAEQAKIFSLAVHEEWRGRGTGAQLVRYVAKQAGAVDFTFLALSAREEPGEAGQRRLRFFEHLGLRSIADSPRDTAWGAPIATILERHRLRLERPS
ncbi:GNAT family N-acetyltransferase [Streptomyces avermitilis]